MHLKKVDLLGIKKEIHRKFIHISCAIVPLSYNFYFSREQILIFCSIISVFLLTAEILRFRHKKSGVLFQYFFSQLLRENEKKSHITGATTLFISATITFIIFKKEIAVPAVLILTIADASAAIAGKLTESMIIFGKSLSGSLTFFFTSFIILLLLVPELGLYIPVVAILVTLVEVLPLPINDNLWISFATGILLYMLL